MPRNSALPCPPLFGTPRSPERATLGPRVAEVARRLGKPLMPHQREIVDVAFEIDPATGLLAYDVVLVIGPRQATGKTELLLPVMTHRCIGFEHAGAQRVLYTAQTADQARDKWRDIHLPRLLAARRIRQHMARPSDENGGARLMRTSEAIFWRNGSQWSPGSTTSKTGGTGDTLDLGVIDEAWSHPDDRVELGMGPAMLTRPWAQLWITSMIPGITRAMPGTWGYLQDKRAVGRSLVEADVRTGMAVFDFAAPPGLDPGDPTTWQLAMPGLERPGFRGTVALRKVQSDWNKTHGDPVRVINFCAEYLGWEPGQAAPRWTLIKKSTWEALHDPYSTIAGAAALGVEVSEDRRTAWIGAGGRRADRHWHVEIVEPGLRVPAGVQGMDWLLPALLELWATGRFCTVVIDPSRPAASLVVPLRNAGVDVTTPNQGEVAGACGRFYDATGEAREYIFEATGERVEEDDEARKARDDGVRVFHLGQPEIEKGLAGAKKLDRGNGAFTFVKKGSANQLGSLYCVVLAMHGHDVKGHETVLEPDIFV